MTAKCTTSCWPNEMMRKNKRKDKKRKKLWQQEQINNVNCFGRSTTSVLIKWHFSRHVCRQRATLHSLGTIDVSIGPASFNFSPSFAVSGSRLFQLLVAPSLFLVLWILIRVVYKISIYVHQSSSSTTAEKEKNIKKNTPAFHISQVATSLFGKWRKVANNVPIDCVFVSRTIFLCVAKRWMRSTCFSFTFFFRCLPLRSLNTVAGARLLKRRMNLLYNAWLKNLFIWHHISRYTVAQWFDSLRHHCVPPYRIATTLSGNLVNYVVSTVCWSDHNFIN